MAGGQWRLNVPPAAGIITYGNAGQYALAPFTNQPNVYVNTGTFTMPGTAPTNLPDLRNLLGYDRPTVMTNWLLNSLYIPCIAFLQANTVDLPAAAPNLVGRLELAVNGDLVWADQQQALVQPATVNTTTTQFGGTSVTGKGYFAPMVFTADLINAVIIQRASRMSLSLSISCDQSIGAGTALLGLAVGALMNLTDPTRPWRAVQPTIGYTVQQLQGARQL